MAVEEDLLDVRQAVEQPLLQHADALALGAHLLAGDAEGLAHADDLVRRQRARAHAALVAAAVHLRLDAARAACGARTARRCPWGRRSCARPGSSGRPAASPGRSSTLPVACAASTWKMMPRSRHSAPIAGMSWITPISLLTNITASARSRTPPTRRPTSSSRPSTIPASWGLPSPIRTRMPSISPPRSIIIPWCCARAADVALGFQIAPDDDLDAFECQVQGHGLKTQRRKDAEPSITDLITLGGPEGNGHGGVQARCLLRPALSGAGDRPAQARPCRVVRSNVKQVTKFYCDVLGLRKVPDWMGDYFSFLRCGPDHHTINLDRRPMPDRALSTPHSNCARTGHICQAACDYPQPQRLSSLHLGARPARHRPQPLRLSPRAQRPDHRAVRRTRPA